MQHTFDAVEPLPRLCPIDIPVLFEATSSNAAALEDGDGDGDEQDAVATEMDACMRVLEDIKPKVWRDVTEGSSGGNTEGLDYHFLAEGGWGKPRPDFRTTSIIRLHDDSTVS